MTTPNHEAYRWLSSTANNADTTVSVVDIGVAVGRRTGVSHYVTDAAEITVDGETTLAARWLCGGKSVDAAAIDTEAVVCVKCRLAAAVPQCPVVYFCWGEAGDLLYIGSSINVAVRIQQHRSGSPWWSEVRRLTFQECGTEFEARRAEADAIYERPGRHNRESRRSTPRMSLIEGIEIGPAETADPT